MNNRILHVEVIGSNHAALKAFYTALFDWPFEDFPEMGYSSTSGDDRPSVGVGTSMDGTSSYATFYVGTDDVSATVEKAAANGGTVLMPESEIMPGLVIGLMADPEGHVIGLMKN